MEKRKLNVVTLVFYILAAITVVYALYALVAACQYIGEYISAGYITFSDSFGEIIGYIITQVGPHIFYACGFFGLGYIINVLKPGAVVVAEVKEAEPEEVAEEEVDEDAEAEVVEDTENVEEVVDDGTETVEAEAGEDVLPEAEVDQLEVEVQ